MLLVIKTIDIFDGVKTIDFDEAVSKGLIEFIGEDACTAYFEAVKAKAVNPSVFSDGKFKVVYTPLNGSGLECVTKILNRIGITDVTVVPAQEKPDGNFPTCPYPNPEIREAMEEGLTICKKVHPDLLLGTDPDCDRMGTAVLNNNDYVLITGNEMGILLFDYICRQRIAHKTMPERPVAVTTIVSTDMADAIATEYGVELRRVLTGFKFIGEQIGALEAEGHPERFIFGFEESYGYLSGSHVRDKDAVNASMLCCEMTAWYKKQGLTLADALDALYQKYGCYCNDLASFTYEGADGMKKMDQIMHNFRTHAPGFLNDEPITKTVDYLTGEGVALSLPKSNVLEFQSAHAKVLVRPSGTEPKIKVYLSSNAANMEDAKEINKKILTAISENYCHS